MTPPDERVRAILAALDALPPGLLQQTAAFLPAPAGDVLRAVAAAQAAPDREAAMRRVVEAHLADLEAVARLFGGGAPGGASAAPEASASGFPLPSSVDRRQAETGVGGPSPAGPGASAETGASPGPGAPAGPGPTVEQLLGGAFAGQLARVTADLDRADALAASLGRAQAELAQALDPLVDRVADDDALAEQARHAAAELRDPAIAALVSAITTEAAGLRDLVRAVTSAPIGGPLPDLADVEARVARLEARAAEATRIGQSFPARVAAPLAELAVLARARSHPSAPELAQVDARMEEMVAGPTAPATRTKWRRALDLALAAKRVDLAWTAGKRVQVEALDAGDKKLAALVAHRVADLAHAAGAYDVAATARMEEALLLARTPGFEGQARAMADAVVTGTEAAPPSVRARVLLMAGQLAEVLGDEARARALYGRVMRLKADAPPAELGRAALHLGRLELRGGQPSQGRKNVRLAYDLAVDRGDPMLYAEAVPTLIEALVDAGREADAAAVAREARDRYTRMGQGEAFRADLEKRWGAARVAAWWA